MIFLESREKKVNFDIKIVIFRAQLDLLWFLKFNGQKITKIKVSVKIFYLTSQMISKSDKSLMHRKITIRRLQRLQNW